jgi:hypothetical protein
MKTSFLREELAKSDRAEWTLPAKLTTPQSVR